MLDVYVCDVVPRTAASRSAWWILAQTSVLQSRAQGDRSAADLPLYLSSMRPQAVESRQRNDRLGGITLRSLLPCPTCWEILGRNGFWVRAIRGRSRSMLKDTTLLGGVGLAIALEVGWWMAPTWTLSVSAN